MYARTASLEVLTAILGILCLQGCTIAPRTVPASTMAFSGNSANGGIIDLGPGNKGPATVTESWVKAYAVLAEKYGKDLTPKVKPGDGVNPQPDGTYTVDFEHLADKNVMATMSRSGFIP